MDKVRLLTEAALQEINEVGVEAGPPVVLKDPVTPRKGRLDSFVAQTDVPWPTEGRLLGEAVPGLIRAVARPGAAPPINRWRKHQNGPRRVQPAFNQGRPHPRRRKPEHIHAYLSRCKAVVEQAEPSMDGWPSPGLDPDRLAYDRGPAVRPIDQVDRRLLKGEPIPHEEKVCSIQAPPPGGSTRGKRG